MTASPAPAPSLDRGSRRNAAILITGAGGEVGHGLIQAMHASGRGAVVAIDIRELDPNLRALCQDTYVGDICDDSLLERLLAAAEEGGRMGSEIEIRLLQAMANQMRGDIPSALAALEKALTLAEPEGYVRLFLDEGEAVRSLIEDLKLQMGRQARQDQPLIPYIEKLLKSFARSPEGPQPSIPPTEDLIEPLSQRELDVLRLFKTELSGPEIASQLVIGLSTVRTHTKSIYSKLNVNSRRAAVKRAEELGLI